MTLEYHVTISYPLTLHMDHYFSPSKKIYHSVIRSYSNEIVIYLVQLLLFSYHFLFVATTQLLYASRSAQFLQKSITGNHINIYQIKMAFAVFELVWYFEIYQHSLCLRFSQMILAQYQFLLVVPLVDSISVERSQISF